MTKREHIAFISGILILGVFFGTVIFYNLPEFWGPARLWDVRSSFTASWLLAVPIIISYHFKSPIKIWVFLGLLAIALLLITWIEDLYTLQLLSNNLLADIQLTQSWRYRLFVAIPIILSLLSHYACGLFLLSFFRFATGAGIKSSPTTSSLPTPLPNIPMTVTGFGVITSVTLTIAFMHLITSGPIYSTFAFEPSTSKELRKTTYKTLQKQWFPHDKVKTINTYVSHADTDNESAQSIFENILLVEIIPEDFWWRGKRRETLINGLTDMPPNIELLTYKDATPPSVPLKPSYIFNQLDYIPDQDVLLRIGIDPSLWSKAVATRMRLMSKSTSIQSLENTTIIVEGKAFTIGRLGSFKVSKKEIQTENFPEPNWIPLLTLEATTVSGIIISLNENKIHAHALNLNEIENIISTHLNVDNTDPSIETLKKLTVLNLNDGGEVFLSDIAAIKQGKIERPYSEFGGQHYKVEIIK